MARSESLQVEPQERMLTIAQVAALLHIHPNTVRVWSNKGLIKSYRLGYRRDRRFKLQDVDEFLGSGKPAEHAQGG